MNFKILASLLILVGAAVAQNDPLTEIYNRVFALYNQFEGFQDTSRLTMGVIARDPTTRVIEVLVNEIDSWQARLLRHCSMPMSTEAAGEILRSCSEEASTVVLQLQSDVFEVLESMRDASTELSTSIMRELAGFNIVLNSDTFVAHFEPIIAGFQTTLDDYVYLVGQKLNQFIVTGDALPQNTQQCIAGSFRKILESCM